MLTPSVAIAATSPFADGLHGSRSPVVRSIAARWPRGADVVPLGEITLVKSPPMYSVVPTITCALTALEAPQVESVGFPGGVACAADGSTSGSATSTTMASPRVRPLHRWYIRPSPPVCSVSVRVVAVDFPCVERPKLGPKGG